MRHLHRIAGFNLVEFMITIAVVVVLGVIAVSSYQNYVRKTYYLEVVSATTPFKIAVGDCVNKHKILLGCSNGKYGIPAAIKVPQAAVSSLTVIDGVITATPVPAYGVMATDIYILSPAVEKSGTITWMPEGGGVTKEYAE